LTNSAEFREEYKQKGKKKEELVKYSWATRERGDASMRTIAKYQKALHTEI